MFIEMKKKVLIVSACSTRGNTGGLTGKIVNRIKSFESFVEVSLLDISFLQYHDSGVFDAHHFYEMPTSLWVKFLMLFPYIRRWFRKIIVCKEYQKLLKKQQFDLIIIYELPNYTDILVEYAHRLGSKVMLYPWGSDVLRAKRSTISHHKRAFENADYISGSYDSVLMKHAQEFYGVDDKKMFLVYTALPGVAEITKYAGKMSRQEMTEELGIPMSNCNIVCGYNGVEGQRHSIIIENIAKIKDRLPKDYLLIFPVTYGKGQEYYQRLKEKVMREGLNAIFLEEFLSIKEMVCLHLITDLFINIQPSDNGNAFLLEALSANNKIICGKWLVYPQLEKYGIPYYQCETPDTLHESILEALADKESKVPKELINELRRYTPDDLISLWSAFLKNI